MLHSASLPFVIRREHGVVGNHEITSTREELHGLLRLDGDRLLIQWRSTREVSRVGREIRTDRDLAPIRDVALPLTGIAGAHIRHVWRGWRRRAVLVLTAADLRAFEELTGSADAPGLVLEHPAELLLELRPVDDAPARSFVSELSLALAEDVLRQLDAGDEPPRLSEGGAID